MSNVATAIRASRKVERAWLRSVGLSEREVPLPVAQEIAARVVLSSLPTDVAERLINFEPQSIAQKRDKQDEARTELARTLYDDQLRVQARHAVADKRCDEKIAAAERLRETECKEARNVFELRSESLYENGNDEYRNGWDAALAVNEKRQRAVFQAFDDESAAQKAVWAERDAACEAADAKYEALINAPVEQPETPPTTSPACA